MAYREGLNLLPTCLFPGSGYHIKFVGQKVEGQHIRDDANQRNVKEGNTMSAKYEFATYKRNNANNDGKEKSQQQFHQFFSCFLVLDDGVHFLSFPFVAYTFIIGRPRNKVQTTHYPYYPVLRVIRIVLTNTI